MSKTLSYWSTSSAPAQPFTCSPVPSTRGLSQGNPRDLHSRPLCLWLTWGSGVQEGMRLGTQVTVWALAMEMCLASFLLSGTSQGNAPGGPQHLLATKLTAQPCPWSNLESQKARVGSTQLVRNTPGSTVARQVWASSRHGRERSRAFGAGAGRMGVWVG